MFGWSRACRTSSQGSDDEGQAASLTENIRASVSSTQMNLQLRAQCRDSVVAVGDVTDL